MYFIYSKSHYTDYFLNFSSVKWIVKLNCVQLFMTLWTIARKTSCPSSTPRACSNSCSSSQWCHPTISSSVIPFSFCLQSFTASGSFLVCQFFAIRLPKYWSFTFSISPSNEYSGQISFRMDWLDLLAVLRDSQESSPTPQFKSINSLALSHLYSSTLTAIHDYWKNHSFDKMDLCWQSNVSAF